MHNVSFSMPSLSLNLPIPILWLFFVFQFRLIFPIKLKTGPFYEPVSINHVNHHSKTIL